MNLGCLLKGYVNTKTPRLISPSFSYITLWMELMRIMTELLNNTTSFFQNCPNLEKVNVTLSDYLSESFTQQI